MMSTLSPADPIPINEGEQRKIYNLCAPSLRQHRTHPFTTWSRRRREMRERADQLRSEPHHHKAGNDSRDQYGEVAAACAGVDWRAPADEDGHCSFAVAL